MEKQSAIVARVKAGMVFLDKKYTRKVWRGKVKPRELDMSKECDCMLGQTDDNYDDHSAKLGITNRRAVALGFYAPKYLEEIPGAIFTYYERLTSAWKRALGA